MQFLVREGMIPFLSDGTPLFARDNDRPNAFKELAQRKILLEQQLHQGAGKKKTKRLRSDLEKVKRLERILSWTNHAMIINAQVKNQPPLIQKMIASY